MRKLKTVSAVIYKRHNWMGHGTATRTILRDELTTMASVSSSHNTIKTSTWVGQNYLTGSSGIYLTDNDFTLTVKQKKPMWSKSSGNSNRAAWC